MVREIEGKAMVKVVDSFQDERWSPVVRAAECPPVVAEKCLGQTDCKKVMDDLSR